MENLVKKGLQSSNNVPTKTPRHPVLPVSAELKLAEEEKEKYSGALPDQVLVKPELSQKEVDDMDKLGQQLKRLEVTDAEGKHGSTHTVGLKSRSTEDLCDINYSGRVALRQPDNYMYKRSSWDNHYHAPSWKQRLEKSWSKHPVYLDPSFEYNYAYLPEGLLKDSDNIDERADTDACTDDKYESNFGARSHTQQAGDTSSVINLQSSTQPEQDKEEQRDNVDSSDNVKQAMWKDALDRAGFYVNGELKLPSLDASSESSDDNITLILYPTPETIFRTKYYKKVFERYNPSYRYLQNGCRLYSGRPLPTVHESTIEEAGTISKTIWNVDAPTFVPRCSVVESDEANNTASRNTVEVNRLESQKAHDSRPGISKKKDDEESKDVKDTDRSEHCPSTSGRKLGRCNRTVLKELKKMTKREAEKVNNDEAGASGLEKEDSSSSEEEDSMDLKDYYTGWYNNVTDEDMNFVSNISKTDFDALVNAKFMETMKIVMQDFITTL